MQRFPLADERPSQDEPSSARQRPRNPNPFTAGNFIRETINAAHPSLTLDRLLREAQETETQGAILEQPDSGEENLPAPPEPTERIPASREPSGEEEVYGTQP